MESDLAPSAVDAVVVGAGFAGMYMVHRLRGLGLSVQGFEAGSDVGGTWYWNRYPGARCDIESLEYSYQFDEDLQQEWEWSERYASQPEILRYIEHVADRFELRSSFLFETRVVSASYDEIDDRWIVSASNDQLISARFLIMATGCLSSTNTPAIEGIDDFDGQVLHTGTWPKQGVDLAGKRVGIIGTGSSGVQSIPVLAQQADHLTVFQRTAQYTVPARNRALDPDEVAAIKASYKDFRVENYKNSGAFGSSYRRNDRSILSVEPHEQLAELERRWQVGGVTFTWAFNDVILNAEANEIVAEFVRTKIAQVVKDPQVAALLSPHHTFGCKRLVIDTGYFETFNRDNVTLVDVGTTPISGITSTSVCVGDEQYDLDTLVFATGFDAMTGSILKVNITGRDGLTMANAWSAGPRTYLGLSTPGFPNLFTISGPGSPSVLTNMVASIEQHVNWIADCLEYIQSNSLLSIEANPQAADRWVEHVNAIADQTLFPSCNSWYLGANVPGKTRVFMPLLGFPPYAEKCEQVAADGYEGFDLVAG